MRNWRGLGIAAVASLLEDSEALQVGLGHERDRCEAAGKSFYSLPTPHRSAPAAIDCTEKFIADLQARLMRGENTL
jgi:hypothetical protein